MSIIKSDPKAFFDNPLVSIKVMNDPVSIDEVRELHSLGSSLVDKRRSA